MSDGDGVGHDDHQVNLAGLEFCPRCSSQLATKAVRGHERLVCPSCGYIFYMTPAPVTCAIVHRDRTILLVRRKYPPQAGKWCLPAGFVETREHPEESARREVKEETGLEIEIEGIFDTWASEEDPRTPVVAFAFTARVVGGDLQPGDDADRAEFFEETSLPDDIAFNTHSAAIAKYFEKL
jgi:ADP-ribose pyrophosphatase YjhB (NUDIX family)